ncbi:MAG: polysaccharide deacetylase family protein [Gemmatimonadaceae bacterium]
MRAASDRRTPIAVHVDLDGATHIFRAHGRSFQGPVDTIYTSGMETMLAVFEQHGVRATLFVIGDDARHPEKRPRIAEALAAGHELASHTMTHPNLRRASAAQKERELIDSKTLIEDVFGVRVSGFRAPGYSIDAEALRILGRSGYLYDSSAFPTAEFARRLDCTMADLQQPHRFSNYEGIIELPLPGPAPLAMPLGVSLSLALRIPAVQGTMWLAARRAVPTAILFHLIDFAAPLDRAFRDGPLLSFYTMSTRSAKAKQRICSQVLRFVRARFCLTPTLQLLAPVINGAAHSQTAQ